MAAIDKSLGYQCEFMDPVPEDFYCKSCNLVARKSTIASCCGETYCHACIADTQEQGKPCPACGEKEFTLTKQVKYQKKIRGLQAYCSMKERGCGWSGALEQLDTHLDPDQDNCQYVDTKCPLYCQQAIPKNKMEQHVAQHCAKRPYVCQHCNFKSTYEEVVDTHLPECKYVPLQCPNLCGVTFERDFMEDHMKMCRLEEVGCEFGSVGCDGRFRREDQEEHTRKNSQKHLTLTASLAVETREQLQDQVAKYRVREQNLKQKLEEQKQKLMVQEENLDEQDQKLKEQDQKLKEQDHKLKEQNEQVMEQNNKLKEQDHKLKEQDHKLKEQVHKLKEQDQKLKELYQILKEQDINQKKQDQKLNEQDHKLKEQDQKQNDSITLRLQELELKFKAQLKGVSDETEAKLNPLMTRRFKMEYFSKEKEKGKDMNSLWYGPAMYTHVGGYKFCIGVYANGIGDGLGKAMVVFLYSFPGEFDGQLKWPVKAKFTIELINQHGNNNAIAEACISWDKPITTTFITHFYRITIGGHYHFIEHSQLGDFLVNDTLHFLFSKIEFC